MPMALKKVWMSPNTGIKSWYGLRILGGVAGTVALMMALVAVGVLLIFWLGLPREVSSLVLVCGVTVLAVVLALKVGWRGVRDATVFFLTEEDRLYVMDARALSDYGHGVLGYAFGAMETQNFLRRLAERPYVPDGADEIVKVARIKENRGYYALSCWVRRPNRRAVRNTCFLVKGNRDEDLLLRQLERRQSWKLDLEPGENRRPFCILASGLVMAGFVTLCVLSHPAVARLSPKLYFPCLGGAFLAFFFLVYFIICQRRGQ